MHKGHRRHHGGGFYPVPYYGYGYPYYDYYDIPSYDEPRIIVVNKDSNGKDSSSLRSIHWPTLAISLLITGLLWSRR